MATFLITDDEPIIRMLIKEMLKKLGHEVIGEAENGEKAVQLYQTLKPDVVTMDLTMPVMNGIEAVKEIKKIDEHAVIIMCSAMGQHEIVIDAIQAGAKDFIVKPFELERMQKALANVL